MTHVMAPDERRRRLASGPDLHVSERYDGAQPRSDLNVKNILTYLPTYSLSSRITFKLACLTYKFFTTGQLAYLRMLLYTTTPLHALYGRLINFSSTCRDFPLNLVTDRLVTWLLQSGMDYLLTSDFHLLSTPLNAVWKGGAETASTGKCKCGK